MEIDYRPQASGRLDRHILNITRVIRRVAFLEDILFLLMDEKFSFIFDFQILFYEYRETEKIMIMGTKEHRIFTQNLPDMRYKISITIASPLGGMMMAALPHLLKAENIRILVLLKKIH